MAQLNRRVCGWGARLFLTRWDRRRVNPLRVATGEANTRATELTLLLAKYPRELRTQADRGQPRLDVLAAVEFADAIFATITHTREALARAKRKYNTPGFVLLGHS